MKYAPLALLAVLAGCPDDPPENPPRLWLALYLNETMVQLIDEEPPYF